MAVNVRTNADKSPETQCSKPNKRSKPRSTEDLQDATEGPIALDGSVPTALVQKHPGDVSPKLTPPTNERIRFADLEDYILRAERASIDVPLVDRHSLFRRVKGILPPRLRSDRNTVILIYPGCFNPPHLGHLALLWHAFLCTDDKTVAAMFLPLGSGSLSQKASTVERGCSFKLSHNQRSKLLEDEVLSRFTWVYPGSAEWSAEFILQLQNLAKVDGFRVSFPSLHGGDNFDVFNFEGSLGWGTGSIVSSNIGRPISLRDNTNNDFGPPHQLPTFGSWKRLSRAEPRLWEDESQPSPRCPCWPCKKMGTICPSLFDAESSLSSDRASALMGVLRQAHSTHDTIWQAKRTLHLGTGYVVFIPKGVHSGSENQDPISSTLIRRTFFNTGLEQENFRRLAAKLVPNVNLLVDYIGQTEED